VVLAVYVGTALTLKYLLDFIKCLFYAIYLSMIFMNKGANKTAIDKYQNIVK
jgi:hypothetical protein